MKDWPADEAETRFGEMLSECLQNGPQIVTRQGVEAAVLVPASEWRRLHSTPPPPTLKDWLLTDEARGDLVIPDRKKFRRRPPVGLD